MKCSRVSQAGVELYAFLSRPGCPLTACDTLDSFLHPPHGWHRVQGSHAFHVLDSETSNNQNSLDSSLISSTSLALALACSSKLRRLRPLVHVCFCSNVRQESKR